jgi:hypothetical protein
MTRALTRSAAAAGLSLLAVGCVAPPSQPAAVARPAPPTFSTRGLEAVMGRNAGTLEAQFGRAELDIREGTARKLQFVGELCVLDAYLYPPRQGAEPVVTHIDARLPDGRDTDRAGCVASLGPPVRAR